MNLICPQCNQPIGENDYNISTDIAYCRVCDAKYSLATLSSLDEVDEQTYDDFERKYCQELGYEATAAIPFHVICRAIGGVLLLSMLMTPIFLGITFHQIPTDKMWIIFIVMGAFSVPELILCLFFLAGKYVVSVEHGLLRIRSGVFPLRLNKRMEIDRTTVVHLEKNNNFRVNNQPVDQIAVETKGRKIGFGVMLNAEKKACLMKWLAKHVK